MLALSRRIGQKIVVGDPKNPILVFEIVDIHNGNVRISFDADRNLPINREEIARSKSVSAPVAQS